MNIELLKKTGRLIVAGFDGPQPCEHSDFLVRDLRIGNWIAFSRNIETHEQTAELNRKLIHDTLQFGGDFPFMTIDQEGGIVSRLHGSLNTYPGAMACAASDSGESTALACQITAGHLKSLGFNMNLAPVADINSNPANPIVGTRSYGEKPENVSRHVLAAANGYLQCGVVPVLKHFPGHGDCALDSHFHLPSVTASASVMEKRELLPFTRGIAAGLPAVMVAHLLVPAFDDSGLPASLSPTLIRGLLRQKMGFGGLVMTDCLEMKGIADHYSTGEAVVLAVEAGADLLFISHTAEEQERGVQALYDAVMSGRISESRIDKSLGRMKQCRDRYLPETNTGSEAVPGWSGENPDPRLAAVSRRSMTLLRNRQFLDKTGLKDADSTLILVFQRPDYFIGESTVAGGNPLLRIGKAFPRARFRVIPADKAAEVLKKDPVRPDAYNKILIVTADAGFFTDAVEEINKITATGVPCGIAVMRNPYEATFFPAADYILLAYENTVLAADSVIEVLQGNLNPEGRCPVSISV